MLGLLICAKQTQSRPLLGRSAEQTAPLLLIQAAEEGHLSLRNIEAAAEDAGLALRVCKQTSALLLLLLLLLWLSKERWRRGLICRTGVEQAHCRRLRRLAKGARLARRLCIGKQAHYRIRDERTKDAES